MHLTLGCLPSLAPDAHGMRNHHRWFAGSGLGKVEEPHGREIEHQPVPDPVWQHELGGKYHLGGLPRQPRIDAGVGRHDLFVSEIVAPRDIVQCVLVPGYGNLHFADDVGAVRRQQEPVTGRGSLNGVPLDERPLGEARASAER